MRKVFYFLPLLFCSLFSFSQAGTPDLTFNGTGIQTTTIGPSFDEIYGVSRYPGGKVVVAGVTVGANADFVVARYNADGSLDNTFGAPTGFVVTPIGAADDVGVSIAVQSDGKIVVGGFANMGATGNDFAVVRYNVDGSLDLPFGGGGTGFATVDISGGGSDDQAYSILIQPADQKIVLGGFRSAGGNADYAVVRFTTAGLPDGTFGTGGIFTVDVTGGSNEDFGAGLGIQPDGKLLLAGWTQTGTATGNDIGVIRLTTTGGLDPTFDGDGIVITDGGANTDDRSRSTRVVALPDGDIYVAGTSGTDFLTIRYNSDGSLDGGFDGDGRVITDINGNDIAFALSVESDLKVLVAGTSDNNDLTVVRYTTAGALDGTFGAGGISATDISGVSNDFSYAIDLQFSRIYVGGSTLIGGGNRDFAVVTLINDASALPLNLLSFTAQKQNNNIAINWKTEKEEGITQFVVERSADGKNFAPIGQLTPSKSTSLVKDYSFIDNKPLNATNYYRLAIHEIDATVKHSKIVALKFNKLTKDLEIFQNPVVNNSLRMQLPDGLSGRINLQVVDAAGRIVKTQSFEAMGGSTISTTLDVSTLQQGVYFIRVKSANNISITKKFVKN